MNKELGLLSDVRAAAGVRMNLGAVARCSRYRERSTAARAVVLGTIRSYTRTYKDTV